MNRLLKLTAVIEGATGLALLAAPGVVLQLLLGGETAAASVGPARIAGIGLLSLGIACWPCRDTATNATSAQRAMLIYNSLVAAYLLCLGFGGDRVGLLLWPAVALHAVLSLALAWQSWRKTAGPG
jgi:hypothetical protein